MDEDATVRLLLARRNHARHRATQNAAGDGFAAADAAEGCGCHRRSHLRVDVPPTHPGNTRMRSPAEPAEWHARPADIAARHENDATRQGKAPPVGIVAGEKRGD